VEARWQRADERDAEGAENHAKGAENHAEGAENENENENLIRYRSGSA
jgi:hypothetical protein